MLATAAPLARWIDVFCEPGSPHAFDADEARAVVLAGRAAGLDLRIHGNQLGPGPGVQLAVELGAASVDHCTHLSAADIDALADAAGSTVVTFLPGVEFCTPPPSPTRPTSTGRRLDRAGHRLQPELPLLDAVHDRARRPRDTRQAPLRRDDSRLRPISGVSTSVRSSSAPGDLAVIHAPSYVHLAYRPVRSARALELE